ncbi:transketolase [Clostridium sp. FP2]|uniref:transketolase family protein n=1 Tax=Clostridium sp. FP2 TaxID=2724481 RepID=UPI0013E95893|nr:transketolase C-terminal domain-containing protein [Clostridium sp. FP2]MBZ9624563.1 transketolase [Clostridium sp. FP2]
MRTTFINELTKLCRKNKDIYLLTADLGFSVFEDFKKEFPDRFINVGIAEANMIGIASGIALTGKIVYVYSIIPFLTMRCFEQIRIDVCYQNVNVKLVGVGGGLSYGVQGVTHHSIEDIGIMRTLPNMKVICPGDPFEAREAINESSNLDGPIYIRLNKNNEPLLYEKNPKFQIGKAIKLINGDDLTIIATGNMLESAIEVSNLLRDIGKMVNLVSMHTVKPIDEEMIKECLKKTKYIFTMEEHTLFGGLGSAIAEVIVKDMTNNNIFKAYGIPDKYSECVGSREFLRKEYGIDTISVFNDIVSVTKGS